MKRAILTVVVVLLALGAAPSARAETPQLTVVLAGGVEESAIKIALSSDGRSYAIDSIAPLEVGGEVCWHPEGQSNELLCDAAAIGGFEVNAGAGEDSVIVSGAVPVSVTLRGGPDNDRLVGGANSDKLIGGPGDDVLVGRSGMDSLFGGPGNDRLVGGPHRDTLRGGPGEDGLFGGQGENVLSS